jgi:hypothetical protein
VINRGKGVATDCSAKLRVTSYNNSVRHPSKDLKTLTWDNGLSTKILYPRGEEEKLHVVFADSDMQQIAKDTDKDIYALVATPDAYKNRMYRAQDGFGAGEFEAELSRFKFSRVLSYSIRRILYGKFVHSY